MYGNLIEKSVLAEVIGSGPDVIQDRAILAQQIVKILVEEEEKLIDATQHGAGSDLYYSMPVMVLADALQSTGVECSAHTVGALLGELGLQKIRRKDGYHVYWNAAQAEILCTALEGGRHD